jgi:hypothetical protein
VHGQGLSDVIHAKKTVQKDVEDAVAMLERFDHELW